MKDLFQNIESFHINMIRSRGKTYELPSKVNYYCLLFADGETEAQVQGLTLSEVTSNSLCLIVATSSRHLGQHWYLKASHRWIEDVSLRAENPFSPSPIHA